MHIKGYFTAKNSFAVEVTFNNLTHILSVHAFPLYLVIKNIKKASSTPAVTCYLNRHHIQKSFTTPIYKDWHTIASNTTLSIWLSKPLSTYTNLATFTTILFTPHRHMAHHNIMLNSATYIHLHTPTNRNTPTIATLFFSLSPNNSTQWILVILTWWNSTTC